MGDRRSPFLFSNPLLFQRQLFLLIGGSRDEATLENQTRGFVRDKFYFRPENAEKIVQENTPRSDLFLKDFRPIFLFPFIQPRVVIQPPSTVVTNLKTPLSIYDAPCFLLNSPSLVLLFSRAKKTKRVATRVRIVESVLSPLSTSD